jgi:hypothetical protein
MMGPQPLTTRPEEGDSTRTATEAAGRYPIASRPFDLQAQTRSEQVR